MRFLIGILTGGLITLLVATAMDAPTHPLLTGARDLAASSWDRLISKTSIPSSSNSQRNASLKP